MSKAKGLDEVLWLGQLDVVVLEKVLRKIGIKLLHDILVPVFKFDTLARRGQDDSDGEKS